MLPRAFIAAAILAVLSGGSANAAQICVQPETFDPPLLLAFAELNARQYIAAVADFDTQAADEEACAVGMCDGIAPTTGKLRAAFAYAGSGAAYFGLAEPDIAASSLDHASHAFAKLVRDAKASQAQLDAAAIGEAYAADLRNQKTVLIPPICGARN